MDPSLDYLHHKCSYVGVAQYMDMGFSSLNSIFTCVLVISTCANEELHGTSFWIFIMLSKCIVNLQIIAFPV